MTSRDELRSFGANLVLGVDSLFLGSAFFIYAFRRANAPAWRAAWTELADARGLLAGAVVLLAAAPLLHGRARAVPAVLAGIGAAVCLLLAAPEAPRLMLPGGSRAPQIAFLFFAIVFAVHAVVHAAAGVVAGRSALVRRFLWLQAGFALLILPLVFCW